MHGKDTYINSFIIFISILKIISFLIKYNDNKKISFKILIISYLVALAAGYIISILGF